MFFKDYFPRSMKTLKRKLSTFYVTLQCTGTCSQNRQIYPESFFIPYFDILRLQTLPIVLWSSSPLLFKGCKNMIVHFVFKVLVLYTFKVSGKLFKKILWIKFSHQGIRRKVTMLTIANLIWLHFVENPPLFNFDSNQN